MCIKYIASLISFISPSARAIHVLQIVLNFALFSSQEAKVAYYITLFRQMYSYCKVQECSQIMCAHKPCVCVCVCVCARVRVCGGCVCVCVCVCTL